MLPHPREWHDDVAQFRIAHDDCQDVVGFTYTLPYQKCRHRPAFYTFNPVFAHVVHVQFSMKKSGEMVLQLVLFFAWDLTPAGHSVHYIVFHILSKFDHC